MLTISILVVTNLATLIAFVCYYRKVSSYKNQLAEWQERYRSNPGYDCQQMMADLLSGQGLFRIERIERENLFLFRK
jgi:hypothetical protein